MFERYTEKARRTIFFGRFEACQLGSSYIETEHLLLGLLREDKPLIHRFLRAAGVVESIRKQIEDRASADKKPPISTSVDSFGGGWLLDISPKPSFTSPFVRRCQLLRISAVTSHANSPAGPDLLG